MATTTAKGDDKPKSLTRKAFDALPVWLSSALVSRRAWKTWVRCMIATFAGLILMLVTPVLSLFGQAGFFGLIVSQMLPPSLPLSIYFFAMFTLAFGMLLGWAWGAAAFAAALHVRSAAKTQMQYQAAQATWDPNVPQAVSTQLSLFSGAFLQPSSSAVFGVFLFIGAYALAWLRASKPKLTLMAIFGTIILDVLACYGPLFPQANYMLPKMMLLPASTFMAVGIICTIIFFPQTLNHLVLDSLVHTSLAPLIGLLALQDEILHTTASDKESWMPLAAKAHGFRQAFIAAAAGIEAQAAMLQLEISRGRISPGQLGALIQKTRNLGTRAFGLGSFVTMIEERHDAMEHWGNTPLPHVTERTKDDVKMMDQAELREGRSLDDLMPDLAASTQRLRTAAQKGLEGASAWLDDINQHRWKKLPKDATTTLQRKENLDELKAALAEYRNDKHFTIMERFRSVFDPNTGLVLESEVTRLAGTFRGLFQCFTFTSSLIAFSHELVTYLEFTLLIELDQPKNKFQFPGKFVQQVIENANDSTGGTNNYDIGIQDQLVDDGSEASTHLRDSDDEGESKADRKLRKKKRAERKWRADPDARTPKNGMQRMGRTMAHIWRGLSGPNGLFALRYGIVSIALWIPSVLPSSAKFSYENRALWALIMAQTGMGVFTGEQVLNFVTRMTGTCIGVVLGMVVWYIGAPGKGHGNAYGVAAATMVFVGPFLFVRIVAPPQAMGFWIMTAVTIVFVVGYSWVDEKIEQPFNSGSGAALAGKRALLVIIGFVAGFIVMVFPRPVSAKKLVRQGLSKNIVGLGELYGLEVAAFERSRNEDLTPAMTTARELQFRERFMKLFARLQAIQMRVAFAKFEPNFKGPWPAAEYEALLKIQSQMLSALGVLAASYAQLDSAWCRRLSQREVMNPTFVADCFTLFALLRHSLRHGVPLPPIIPIFERLLYHRRGAQAQYIANRSRNASRVNVSQSEKGRTADTSSDSSEDLTLQPEAVMIEAFGEMLTWQSCHDEKFAMFATALISFVHVITALNRMHGVVLDLVGEVELEGFDEAHERWTRAEVVV